MADEEVQVRIRVISRILPAVANIPRMGSGDANGTRSRIWTDAQGKDLFVEVNRISTVTPAGQKRGAAGLGRSMEGTAFHRRNVLAGYNGGSRQRSRHFTVPEGLSGHFQTSSAAGATILERHRGRL